MSINARGGNALLLRFIDSPHFTLFMCVSYLERYAGNVGIHFYLCQKLRSYSSEEIEFFLPQLVQLQVTVETESMALEDLLLDLCHDSTHCTLLVFWQLQAHLTELASDPESYGFQVCKRLYNKLQYLLFNVGDPPSHKIRENTFPALVLASSLAGAAAGPLMAEFIKPLVVSQGRKQRSHIFHLASKLLRSKSTTAVKTKSLQDGSTGAASSSPDLAINRTYQNRDNNNVNDQQDITNEHIHSPPTISPNPHRPSALIRTQSSDNVPISGPPDSEILGKHSPSPSITSNASASSLQHFNNRQHMLVPPQLELSREEKVKNLRTNYFRCETQFVYALQAISARLLQVPKQARLSALRAELAMLNRELPAEVDIPMLLPTKTKGPNARQNRIVRISPAEATVLNSAERVPFLLLIEYLREDIDFDPDSDANKELLAKNADRRYIFDMAYLHDQKSSKTGQVTDDNETGEDDGYNSYEEKDIGDLGSFAEDEALEASFSSIKVKGAALSESKQSNSPRASDLTFSSSYGSPMTTGSNSNLHHTTPTAVSHPNAFDVTDIATHMRTAAIMLSQLDAGGSKLPKDEITSIKSKIIASMQAMEEHTIYANSAMFNGEAGERKLENDLKTAGITSSTTKDDPSAANLGEDWEARKERIRRSSPYGHLPNWDLFSVIAKTGSDLRQEAFACQLIQAMQKIWDDAGVDVWVKRMRILITNDSSGLVETITNGLSIHSIKKALTNASVASGSNPKGTIASLSDHFEKVRSLSQKIL